MSDSASSSQAQGSRNGPWLTAGTRKVKRRREQSPRRKSLLNTVGSQGAVPISFNRLINLTDGDQLENLFEENASQILQEAGFQLQSDLESANESDMDTTSGFDKWSEIQLDGPIGNDELNLCLTSIKGKKSLKAFEEAFKRVSCSPSSLKKMVINLKNEITPASDPKFRKRLEEVLKYWPRSQKPPDKEN